MKYRSTYLLVAALISAVFTTELTAQTSAFTYQGRLSDSGKPASGLYDLVFSIHDAGSGGKQIGASLTNQAVALSEGLFTVRLDFGPGVFSGVDRWVQIAVCTNGSSGAFTVLDPRQALTPVPTAMYALTPAGPQGPEGSVGPQGDQGPAGATGPQGPEGVAGPQGPEGPQGPIGLTGATGLQGPQGPIGLTGATGPEGPAGATGPEGPMGPQGPQGPKGLNWLGAWSGTTSYAADDAVFYNGSAWTALRVNANVTPSEGPYWTLLAQQGSEGPTGATGAQGPEGAQGPIGLTGAAGPQGPIGLTGAIGPEGPAGATGQEGPMGPQGPQGLQGEPGLQGPKGINWLGAWNGAASYAADDAVFYNGSAWTALRANANVSPSEGPDWTLLAQQGSEGPTGPQGDQGPTGAMGAQGPEGPIGLTGATGAQGPQGDPGPEGPAGASPFMLAGTNAFYVDGHVGIGTNDPATALHVVGTVTADGFEGSVDASQITGALPATQLSGTIQPAQLQGTYGNAVTLNNTANSFLGSFQGNGTGMTNVDAATVGGLAAGAFWQRAGNQGTTPGTHFLGTTDDQALELRVNNSRALRLEPNANGPNVIGGYSGNFVAAGVFGATIGGGGTLGHSNGVSSPYATLGGGFGNMIQSGSLAATLGGGQNNTIQTNAYYSTIGGGNENTIETDTYNSTIGGGFINTIQPHADYSTIGGGFINTIQTNSDASVIGGGYENTIQADASSSTIGGGRFNLIQPNAFYSTIGGGCANAVQPNAFYSTIAGGLQNTIQTNGEASIIGGGYQNIIQANADYSIIGGGYLNTIQTNADYATIPGGRLNSATNYAFAAGFRAKANHLGSFVWADSHDADFASTADNQFNVRAFGGLRLETSGAGMTLDGQPVLTGTVTSAGIADSAVTTSKLANGAVGTAQLADNSVTPAKILDGTITTSKLANGAVGSPQLADNSVTTAKILNGTIAAEDVNAASFDTTFWKVGGNAGTTPDTHFLGTTDNQPLELKIKGMRALRLEDNGDSSDSLTLPDGAPNLIGGSPLNSVGTGVVGATIAGGGATNYYGLAGANTISGDYGTIGGGVGNQVEAGSSSATVAGGRNNNVGSSSAYSAIGGGYDNNVAETSMYATIAGGRSNDAGTNSDYSAISGGYDNNIAISAQCVTIAGGYYNDVGASSSYVTIGGGNDNNVAGGSLYATVAGGYTNNVGMDAEGGTIAGGRGNKVLDTAWEGSVGGGYQNIAGNQYATVPGGYRNEANGFYSFAAGRQAKANAQGSFVWGDSTAADVVSTTANSVTMRASGGYRLFSSTDTVAPAAGVYLAPGASSWSTISDRAAKKDFAPVDGVAMLEKLARVPVQQWHYDWEERSETPHIGPMAQDFKAAFYPGRDDKSISTLEIDGVALAAIQGLNQKLEQELEQKDAKIRNLENELGRLRDLMTDLSRKLDGGAR